MTELRECPFCGCDSVDYMPDRLMAPGAEPPVFCNECHASAMDASAWNRRAPSAAVVGLVEAAELLAGFAESASTLDFNEDRNVTWAAVVSAQARSALAAYKQEIKG